MHVKSHPVFLYQKIHVENLLSEMDTKKYTFELHRIFWFIFPPNKKNNNQNCMHSIIQNGNEKNVVNFLRVRDKHA